VATYSIEDVKDRHEPMTLDSLIFCCLSAPTLDKLKIWLRIFGRAQQILSVQWVRRILRPFWCGFAIILNLSLRYCGFTTLSGYRFLQFCKFWCAFSGICVFPVFRPPLRHPPVSINSMQSCALLTLRYFNSLQQCEKLSSSCPSHEKDQMNHCLQDSFLRIFRAIPTMPEAIFSATKQSSFLNHDEICI